MKLSKSLAYVGLVLFLSHPLARAEEERNVKWGGSARFRLEFDDYNNFQNVRQMTWMRFRPFVNVQAEPGLSFYFEPQFAKAMGQNSVAANSTAAATTPEQVSGTTADPSLGVHQAYVDYALSSAFSVKAGRQVLSYGDELILGALEWNAVGRSFDAIKFRYGSDTAKHDVFFSKIVDANVTGSGGGDYDFMGNYNSLTAIGGIKELDFYLLYMKDSRGAGPAPIRQGTIGTRIKSNIGEQGDYRAEFTQQFGNLAGITSNAYGTQGDLEFGYTFAGTKPLRMGVETFYADSDYNQLFPTAHKWLGILDAFGRRNIYGAALHASAKLSDSFKLTTDLHHFYRAKDSAPAYNTTGSAITGSNTGSKSLGTELDLVGHYDMSARTSLQLGAAVLFPSTSLKTVHDGKPFFAYASWDVKF